MAHIGRKQVERWRELAARTPDPLCDQSRTSLPNVDSILIESRSDGLNFRARCSRGRHHDLAINAALAMTLFHQILQAGLDGGWLDEDYDLIVRD